MCCTVNRNSESHIIHGNNVVLTNDRNLFMDHSNTNVSMKSNYTRKGFDHEAFVPFLLNISIKLLEDVKQNIKFNYNLSIEETRVIDEAFLASNIEYNLNLKNNFDKMSGNIKYTSPDIFLLDFTDFSNFLLQTIIQERLNGVNGKCLEKTVWYKPVLKHIILRQQVKIILNIIEVNICYRFDICVEKTEISEYLVEWLRHLLNVEDTKLDEFMRLIPILLYKYINNNKIVQKAKSYVGTNTFDQRFLIDIIDEALTEQEVEKIVRNELVTHVTLMKKLMDLINSHYNLEDSRDVLDKISKNFWLWTVGNDVNLMSVLEDICYNFQENVQSWPIEIRIRMHNYFSKLFEIS